MRLLLVLLCLFISQCNFLGSEETKKSSSGPLVFPRSMLNYLQSFSFFLPELVAEISSYTRQGEQDLALYDVEVHRLTYPMLDANQTTVTASALLFIPKTQDLSQKLPLSIVSHPTIFSKAEAPSNQLDSLLANLFGSLDNVEAQKVEDKFNNAPSKLQISTRLLAIEGLIDAYRGFVTIVPDYLGYGTSANDVTAQPYLVANYYASEGLEALKKARNVLDSLDITLSDKLFLRGYSEGGYATLVIQEKLESLGESITASAPSAGPYYLPLTIQSQVAQNTLSLPAVLPKILTSYRIYEELLLDREQIYTGPSSEVNLDSLILEKKLNGASVSAIMGDTVDQVLSPEAISIIRQDSITNSFLQPLFEKLEANTPASAKGEATLSSPTRLYTCDADDLIDSRNSDSLASVQNIPVVKFPGEEHSNCRAYSAPLVWFDSLVNGL